jgi:uncharacterized protein YndB with AHSA1/START domain
MHDETSTTTEDRVSREITISRRFDAPRELVFRAWTDARHITRWWGPEGFSVSSCESDPRPGGSLLIVMRGPDGADHPMTGTYLEVDPPQRLVLESRAVDDEGQPLIEALNTVTFAEADGGTEVTVHALAFGLTAEAAVMLAGMEAGWTQSLQCLDDMLTGAAERQFVVLRLFEAPREVVFRAWVDPGQLSTWWSPQGFGLTIDEIDEPRRLVYRHSGEGSAADDPAFRTTVTLDGFGGNTVLTIRVTFETAADRDLVAEKHHAVEGANQTLDRLADHLASRQSRA